MIFKWFPHYDRSTNFPRLPMSSFLFCDLMELNPGLETSGPFDMRSPCGRPYIGGVIVGIGCCMTPQYRPIYLLLPSGRHSPALSAIRPSPLSSIGSYSISASPFTTSPSLSFISTTATDSPLPVPEEADIPTAPPSPDLFEGFEFTPEMFSSLQIIEEADDQRHRDGLLPLSLHNSVLMFDDTAPMLSTREEKAWVIFHGKNPGVYYDL